MNWTDLQENWVPLSDADKFRKYARENRINKAVETKQSETYYEKDKGVSYNNITEISFTNVLTNIETEILRIISKSGLKNIELLARIVGVTMLKMRPKEIAARERFEKWCKRRKIEQKFENTTNIKNICTNSLKLYNSSNKKPANNKPPEFYYPM
ncbi:MAG: hypothetical protein LBI80_05595 [Endomicrobium sp.]|nr:hypothetical protein [Endomicrobium sp.]